jgi:hypothetical protein
MIILKLSLIPLFVLGSMAFSSCSPKVAGGPGGHKAISVTSLIRDPGTNQAATILTAVCDDGSVWELDEHYGGGVWKQVSK